MLSKLNLCIFDLKENNGSFQLQYSFDFLGWADGWQGVLSDPSQGAWVIHVCHGCCSSVWQNLARKRIILDQMLALASKCCVNFQIIIWWWWWLRFNPCLCCWLQQCQCWPGTTTFMTVWVRATGRTRRVASHPDCCGMAARSPRWLKNFRRSPLVRKHANHWFNEACQLLIHCPPHPSHLPLLLCPYFTDLILNECSITQLCWREGTPSGHYKKMFSGACASNLGTGFNICCNICAEVSTFVMWLLRGQSLVSMCILAVLLLLFLRVLSAE